MRQDETMNEKHAIDLGSWPRRETFEHFRSRVPCTYSVTVELDATRFVAAIAQSGRKTYPAQVWAIAAVVNRHEEFRISVDGSGAPSVWSVVHPYFTVFNPERETFAGVWAEYDDDFGRFHSRAVETLAEYRSTASFAPQGDPPANVFDVSSLPWASFTGFNLNIQQGYGHYLPIFTLGKYVERDGRMLLPFALQIHHAAADGFHAARLFTELQELFDTAESWL
nr:Chloramphenicol_Acetyltransferase_CAT [uncultured bacterium]